MSPTELAGFAQVVAAKAKAVAAPVQPPRKAKQYRGIAVGALLPSTAHAGTGDAGNTHEVDLTCTEVCLHLTVSGRRSPEAKP